MQANRRRDTTPELRLRRLLHAQGLRYYVDRRALKDLRWKADLVFPRTRVAVFVDGCFWHGCPEHSATPRVNRGYWAPKIARNQQRDREFDRLLREAGWTVVRAWEHEPVEAVATRVMAAVGR
jgi:DNA mismatch endonuclease (patch repair protein)